MALTFETKWDEASNVTRGSEEELQAFWAGLTEEERYWAMAANVLNECGYRVSEEKLALAATWKVLRATQKNVL